VVSFSRFAQEGGDTGFAISHVIPPE
jgi:hypothetical protein